MENSKELNKVVKELYELLIGEIKYGFLYVGQFVNVKVLKIEEEDTLSFGKPVERTERQLVSEAIFIPELEEVSLERFDAVNGEYVDMFFSPMIYKKPQRKGENASYFTTLFVDIDNCEYEEARERIVTKLPGLLQNPTMIVSSGSGVHVYWVLTYKLPIEQYVHNWKRVMFEIAKLLEGDTKVIEPARMMRLPGTINSKSHNKCEVIDLNKESLVDFLQVYKVFHLDKSKIRFQRKINKRELKEISNEGSYSKQLIEEVFQLTSRRSNRGQDIGYRNTTLLILKQLHVHEDRIRYMNDEIFSTGLSEKEVANILSKKLNPPKRAKVFNRLDVSPEEQQDFRWLVSEETIELMNQIKLVERKLFRKSRRVLLKVLRQEYSSSGLTLQELAANMNVSKRTVSRRKLEVAGGIDYKSVDKVFQELQEALNKLNTYYEMNEQAIVSKKALAEYRIVLAIYDHLNNIYKSTKELRGQAKKVEICIHILDYIRQLEEM